MFKKIRNILIISVVIFITVISMTNLHPVTLKILMYSVEIPLVVLFYLLLITGFSAGYLVKGIVDYRKNK